MRVLISISNLDEAINFITPMFKGMDNIFSSKSEDEFAAYCHSQMSGGIGMQIRNGLGLWGKNKLLIEHMKTVHNCPHPDNMSDLIIRKIHQVFNTHKS